MKNEIKLSILSDKKNISIIRNIIGCILIDYNPTVSFINEIKTVLSEAVTNCIVHAYESMPDKWIDINIGISIEKVSLEVIDKGIGIENVDLAMAEFEQQMRYVGLSLEEEEEEQEIER